MAIPEDQTDSAGARVWLSRTVAFGLSASALIMLSALMAFRPEHTVKWPPSSPALYTVSFAVFGTLAAAVMIMFIYLTVSVIAVLAGKQRWRDLLQKMVSFAVVLALLAASVSAGLKAFYWPWALSSAVRTILSNDAKWRLVASASVVGDHGEPDAIRILKSALADKSPSVQAAAAYALAASGRKDYLRLLCDIAAKLPPARPDGAPPSRDNDVAAREDVLWLLRAILPLNPPSIEVLRDRLASQTGLITWNPVSKTYLLSGNALASEEDFAE